MLRAWIISFSAVALVVAAILLFSHKSPVDPKQPETTDATTRKQSLTTNEVIKYLEVWPKIDALLIASMESGNASAAGNRDAVREVLTLNSLSDESWDSLWRRIEDAVNAIRAETANPDRVAQIQARLDLKKAALANAEGKAKEMLETEVAALEADRDRRLVGVHPIDRQILMRFWAQLDQQVPRLRPQ